MRSVVAKIDGRLYIVESWKAERELRARINAENKAAAREDTDDALRRTALKTLKDLAPVITVLGMLAYAMLQYIHSRGGKP